MRSLLHPALGTPAAVWPETCSHRGASVQAGRPNVKGQQEFRCTACGKRFVRLAVPYRPWADPDARKRSRASQDSVTRLLAAAGVDVVAHRVKDADLRDRGLVLDSGAQIGYDQLVVATGAVAHRERVPSAAEHALFSADAAQFAARILSASPKVAVIFGWERPGPGLEYAGWIAAYRPRVQVTAIDGDGTLERRFGGQATARLKRLFEKRGARLITGRAVERVSQGRVGLAGAPLMPM